METALLVLVDVLEACVVGEMGDAGDNVSWEVMELSGCDESIGRGATESSRKCRAALKKL